MLVVVATGINPSLSRPTLELLLFDVATKSPICCHIDFLAAGGGGLMEAGRLGASERSQGSEHHPATRASNEGPHEGS